MAEFYTIIDHTADMGISVKAKTPEELYENAARALISVILGDDYHKGKRRENIELNLEGLDWADLMVRWLGEILYLFEGEKKVFVSAKFIRLDTNLLEADIVTTPFNEVHHQVKTFVKAVTYHQARVQKVGDLWETTIIFDV